MKFRPLHDRILVERISAEKKSPGGIIIPDSAQKKSDEGKVLAVGDGRPMDDGTRRPPDVKVGDHVVFQKYAGNEVKDNDNVIVIREEDILGVFE